MDANDIIEEMISLSSLPKSRWQTLLNIETIKKRNKPKEAPKAPEKAPFFLPTLPGATPTFTKNDSLVENNSKVVHMGEMDVVTEFIRVLRKCAYEQDCKSNVFAYSRCRILFIIKYNGTFLH